MANKNLKIAGAVFAGILVNFVLSIGTDKVLESMNIFPPIGQGLFITWMLALALSYRIVYTIIGGYIAAAILPENPMKAINILGIVGTFLGILGIFVGWNLSQHWYPISIAATGYLFTWIGGKFYLKINSNKIYDEPNL